MMLVLSSASPRRSELLQEWGYVFTLVQAPVNEDLEKGVLPEEAVQDLARRKALSGYAAWKRQGGAEHDLILGADTIVVLENRILGKPINEEDALQMLTALSGKTHQVMTAITLVNKDEDHVLQVETDFAITTVTFRDVNSREIADYIATGEPMDKAAAYGIQGGAGEFVTEVDGSLTNVIGLPMELLAAKLSARGVFPRG